jgi:hypothetical protein
MPANVGFAILSYNEPAQLLSLVRTLNAMFGAPSIVCHHNFSQCKLDDTLYPSNVQFVRPHIRTRWGHITTVLAALRAFDLLQNGHRRPDWYVLLSGSDYPVRPADKIISELSSNEYDVYLDHREIIYGTIPPNQTAQDGGFGRESWIQLAYDRYCAFRFWWPRYSSELLNSRPFFPFRREHVCIRNPRVLRWIPWDRPTRIYGGRFWLQANNKAIERLLRNSRMQSLVRYYRRRPIPEESLLHTMLCSQPDLRICKDSKRYEDWTGGTAHPEWLTVADVPKIIRSGAHFARKFHPNGDAQGFINERVLKISP